MSTDLLNKFGASRNIFRQRKGVKAARELLQAHGQTESGGVPEDRMQAFIDVANRIDPGLSKLVTERLASRPVNNNDDDADADGAAETFARRAAAPPKSMEEIDTAKIWDRWNSARRR
jgi:hypothetical protein